MNTSTKSRTVSARRRTREQILEAIRNAAIQEFSSNGFKGTSTQKIAELAGLSKPQLHYYIPSKEELFKELLFSILYSWGDAFAFDPQSEDPKTVLSRYVQRKLEYALQNPELSRIFTNELLSGGTRLDDYWPDAFASTRRKVLVIEQWIADGKIRPLNALIFIQQIWGMTQYYADYALQAQVMMDAPLEDQALQQKIVHELTTSVLLICGLAPD